MKKCNLIKNALLCMAFLTVSGCQDFLDVKPEKRLVVPTRLDELQGLLDNYTRVNESGTHAGEVSSDNYYINKEDWLRQRDNMREMYVWGKDNIFLEGNNAWTFEYENIFRANTVLDNITDINLGNFGKEDLNATMGHAYFLRAESFLNTASIWSLAYDENTASIDLGIPLRLSSDFNKPSVRSSVEETYRQIISDFKKAIALLPNKQITEMRPNKFAAYGYLARTYLWMRDYKNAELYADSCLLTKEYKLLNYNDLNTNKAYAFERFNSEVIYEKRMVTPTMLVSSMGKVAIDLIDSYPDDDLRRSLFFGKNNDGSFSFRGSYEGVINLFSGLTLSEMLLTKAEAAIRNGNIKGVDVMNDFLLNRWKKGTYVPFATNDMDSALKKVLEERRKELAFRGLRWMDLKRLNKEGFDIVVKRNFIDQEFTLKPNDLRYALPIPENVISLTGIEQNP